MRNRTVAIYVGGLVLLGVVILAWQGRGDGWPPHDGGLRQTAKVQVSGLRRGGAGAFELQATAHYTPRDADDEAEVAIPKISAIAVSLVDRAGVATPVMLAKRTRDGDRTRAELTLPEVPDGDYLLRVRYRTRLGPGEVEVPLPLYAPARIHVITDRPLYEPGNLVRFRAVVLRAHDLAPLDGRPGTWVVKDAQGEVLLEERAPAGPWGVVAGTFPLDRAAEQGDWKIAWRSGDASDEATFAVRKFTLPRFRIDAGAERPYYRRLEAPVIRGAVTYSSGAPVGAARLEIEWQVAGAWPPPTAWLSELLPKTAVAGANGRFELRLPVVPADLDGQATLVARIAASDPAGDRVESTTQVLLSADGIAVSAVSEYGDRLVEGTSNRVYLRVTTPDGQVVPDAVVKVQRAWQPDDPGLEATLDVDGVASLHLDPGPPVNVVIPALPYRPPPAGDLVSRSDAEELIAGEGAPLADQVEFDRWLGALAPCARFYGEQAEVMVGVRAAASGALTLVAAGDTSPLATCTQAVLRSKRLPPGGERLYSLTFTYVDPPLPFLSVNVASTLTAPDGLDQQFGAAAMRARDCLPADSEGMLPRMLAWQVAAGSKTVTVGPWLADPTAAAAPWSSAVAACVAQRVAGLRPTLEEPAESDDVGVVRFEVNAAEREDAPRPQATTMLGYELLVTTQLPGQPAPASTRLRLEPGQVPPLRLRMSPVVAKAGEAVTAELIRGPGFAASGQRLPEKLTLACTKTSTEADVDDQRKATFTIAGGAEGWCTVDVPGARGLVYVPPAQDLAVSVTPRRATYAPGQEAELVLQTTIAGAGAPAAVGLFGVDDSLGQLVTLPGPGDLARVRPQVETTSPAFGVLDGQALTLGRIRGANAAAATVLRIGAIPTPPELDAVVSAQAATPFDPIAELTDHFYDVLAELHTQARTWERTAPAGELMRPAAMAKLWKQALAACAARGLPIVDAYGRKLRLSRLPADLLALTDPRAVIIVGTRLPEDVEDWAAWVAKEKP